MYSLKYILFVFKVCNKPTKEKEMLTVQDIIAEAQALQVLSDDQTAKSDISHTAAENVTTVTQSQNAIVAQAQADATVAINQAQSKADAAKVSTDEATQKLDEAISKLIEDIKTLAK
jgi:hypothetical protein